MSQGLKSLIAGAALLIAAAPLAHGAVLSLYEFGTSGDNTDADDYGSTDADSNSTASNLTRSSGYGTGTTAQWNTPNSATSYNATASDWRLYRKNQPTYFETEGSDGNFFNDSGRAYAAGTNYLEWTLTPTLGYEMDLTSFTMDVITANSRYFYYYLSSNIDGYGVVIGSVGGVEAGSGSPNVSLTGSQFQGLTTPVTFRLWTWGNQGGSSGSAWQLDSLTINGTTTVPEPGSLAGVAAVGLLLGRRRRVNARD